MKKIVATFFAVMLTAVFTDGHAAAGQAFPPKYYVPNSETATKIAEAVLVPIYGRQKIEKERPFHAELHGDVWLVYGTLPHGHLGGVARVNISRIDGRIVSVGHGE